jgi:hypothetical protein
VRFYVGLKKNKTFSRDSEPYISLTKNAAELDKGKCRAVSGFLMYTGANPTTLEFTTTTPEF